MTIANAGFTPKNRPYDVSHYKITVRLDTGRDVFNNSVEIQFNPLSDIQEIELDSVGLKVSRVSRLPDNETLEFEVDEDKGSLIIHFPEALETDQTQTIQIDYSGVVGQKHEGFFKVLDPDNLKRPPLYFTHFEAVSARKFFPSNDEPYDKATTETIVEVNEPSYQIFSNGEKVAEEVVRDNQGVAWKRAHWSLDSPHSSYLVNVAIGEFESLSDMTAKVPTFIHVGPGKKQAADFGLQVLKASIPFFENYYQVPYPWKTYAMVGLPAFLWGGMENTTLTSMRESALCLDDSSAMLQKLRIADVVAHELAHQWFGDYVTMRWWDDVWLNEAFASYMATRAMEEIADLGLWKKEYSLVSAVTDLWQDYFRQEDGPRSHAIVSASLPSPDDAFDSINYTKGEHVLKMLEFYIGKKAFQKGVANYMKSFAFGNATYQDFFSSMEKSSGADLSGFVKSWLIARGYPVVKIQKKWLAKAQTLELTLTQKPNHKEDKTVFDFKLPVSFYRTDEPAYEVTKVFHIKKDWQRFWVELPAKPQWVSVNPGGVALARFELPDTSEREWSLQALNDPDPIARIAALLHLAEPWTDREAKKLKKLSALARATLNDSLENETSPYVRWALMDKLIVSKWPKFPSDLAEAIFANASDEKAFRDDPMGALLVRTRALALLGKHDGVAGKELIYALAAKPDLALDETSAVAGALARFADGESVGRLNTLLEANKDRGYAFKKAIVSAFGSVSNPQVADKVAEIFKDPELANNEIVGGILWRLHDNEVVRASPKGVALIRDFVLLNNHFSDEIKSRALSILEEVRTVPAGEAVKEITEKSESERLRALAQKILEKNFPKLVRTKS